MLTSILSYGIGTLIAFALVATLGAAALAVRTGVLSVAILFATLALVVMAIRPRWGLLLVFGLALLFEPGNADPAMVIGRYLEAGISSSLGIQQLIFSPLEIALLLTFCSWLLQGIATRRLHLRGGSLGAPVILFTAALLFGFANGIVNGGDLNIALWESRYLVYAIMAYVLVINTVRTRAQLLAVGAVALVSTTGFAIEGAYRKIVLIRAGLLNVPQEFEYAHEDAVILCAAIMFALALIVFGGPRLLRLFGVMALPILFFTLLSAERRAGFIALVVAFTALALVLLFGHRKAFVLVVIPLTVIAVVYVALFWSDTTLLGQPARAIRSLLEPDPRDASSNFYRFLETFNVRTNILTQPWTGVGFGREFTFFTPLPDLSWWPFWHYEAHNQILWVWLKTGALGFVSFLFLMGSALARGARLTTRLADAPLRSLTAFALATVVIALVFSYVDLGLVSARIMLLVGVALGIIGAIDSLQQQTLAANTRPVLLQGSRRLIQPH
jgi:hypothetical protein